MKALALTQAALNMAAKDPRNHPELRQQRDKARALRRQQQADHDARMAKLDGLIQRIGIALGEVDA